nr:hypothetical protein Itr_chr06CG15640 [Ipomoea trifida]
MEFSSGKKYTTLTYPMKRTGDRRRSSRGDAGGEGSRGDASSEGVRRRSAAAWAFGDKREACGDQREVMWTAAEAVDGGRGCGRRQWLCRREAMVDGAAMMAMV